MKFKKTTSGILAALLVLGPLIASVPVARANSYFGGNGRIVFYAPVTLDDSTQEIYTVRADGTGLQQVTDNEFADANPQWAPSGDKIAFDRHLLSGSNQQDIYIQAINSDGTANGAAQVLPGANTTEREFDPSWSPDGETIAYHRRAVVGSGSGPPQIFIIPFNSGAGGTPIRVTNDNDFSDTEPTWSKDGDMLAFRHNQVGSDAAHVAVAAPTANATPTIIDSESSGSIGSPQWSPAADKVVYIKSGDIWVWSEATNTKSKLADGPYSAPTWSPDGRFIALGAADKITYVDAITGAVVAQRTVANSPGQTNEVDWARAAAPPSTEHECTTYVNEDCTEFTPEIPELCQEIATDPTHGTPKYENGGFVYTPEQDYVGEDEYIYEYHDENMNTITCTIHITVLPRPPGPPGAPNPSTPNIPGVPNAGTFNPATAMRYGLLGLGGVGVTWLLRRRLGSH